MLTLTREKVLIYLSSIVGLCALLAIIGWQFNIPQLRGLSLSVTPMNPVSAISFLFCAVWLFLDHNPKFEIARKIIWVCVGIVGIIHFATTVVRQK